MATENFEKGVNVLIETLGEYQKYYKWWQDGIKEIDELKLQLDKIVQENQSLINKIEKK